MKSVVKFVSMVGAGLLAAGSAFAQKADPLNSVPEPGSLALVGLAIGVAVLVARKGRK
jgi:hypothetical protein